MNAHATTESMLADAVEQALFVKSAPEEDLERQVDFQRKHLKNVKARISSTEAGLKAALATLAASTKAEKQRHADAMAQIAERTSEAREVARRDIAADQKVAAASRAWLKAAE